MNWLFRKTQPLGTELKLSRQIILSGKVAIQQWAITVSFTGQPI
jgi:hypothetical protein